MKTYYVVVTDSGESTYFRYLDNAKDYLLETAKETPTGWIINGWIDRIHFEEDYNNEDGEDEE